MKAIFLSRIITLSIVCSSFQLLAQNYVLDTGHTYVGFAAERFLVGEVVGRFNDFEATISIQENDFTSLQMNAKIQVNSLDSNNETRDGHLKGGIWLDVQQYPEIEFQVTQVTRIEDQYRMQGELTIKGITNSVEFPVEFLGPFKDPTQKTTIALNGDFSINRFDYGIAFNKKMDNGNFFIGETVAIKLRILAYQE